MPAVPAEPGTRTSPAPASPGATRSGLVGTYTARDAAGSTCRISLSSSPSLDLYKASSAGCQNRDLGRITAWDYREGEVYLYQPGGSVAARLRGGAGELSGVLAKSGAPLTLTR
ncbi:AprI/Inh family metalloprotease inhibitor [Enterovirga aerilata]